MIKYAIGLVAVVVLAITTAAWAADVVNQGAGSNAVTPWKVRLVTSTGTAVDSVGLVGPAITAGAPAFNLAVSTTSTPTAALTAGATYRVACNGQVFFRTGAATPVAVTTDAPIYGPAVEYLTLATGSTMFAFVTASGTASCVGTRLAAAP